MYGASEENDSHACIPASCGRVLSLLALSGAVTLGVDKIAKELTGAEVTTLAANGYNSTAGNLIVVWTVIYSGAQPVSSVRDSAGDTFMSLTQNRGTWYGQWFYARNVKGDPFNVVTIHPAATGRATPGNGRTVRRQARR